MPEKKKDHADWAITKGRITRWQKEQHWQRIIFISVSVVIFVVLALVGYAIYKNASDDNHENNPTVLKVNDQSFDMDYYVKMLRLYGIRGTYDPAEQSQKAQQILQTLENNEIIAQLAPGLGISVNEAEIDAEIKQQLTPSAESSDGSNPLPTYDDALKQLKTNLKNIGVAEKYYRGAVASDILSKKVQDYISQRDVKNEMPQSHLEGILIDVKAPADEATTAEENTEGQVEIKAVINENPAKIRETIKARLDAGEDFAALAEEFSKDSGSRVKGGDLGWMPRDLLSGEFAKAAFDSEVGVMGQPIPISASADNTQYWLVKVLERQESRPLEENQRQTLQNKAFNDWFTEQRKTLTIVNDLLNPDLRALAITKALS